MVLGPSTKNKLTREQRAGARERVLTAAYQLFSRQGLAAEGKELRLRGFCARVVSGGTVRPGDAAVLLGA